MPEVTLTRFVDFVSKAGTPKMTVVKDWKYRDDYSPATDYYKRIRDAIVEMHKRGRSTASLVSFAESLDDPKKRDSYIEIAKGYRRWVGKKTVTWFAPPSGLWSHAGLDVAVNPEIGLVINGTPHLLKLYFKADGLTKNRIDLVTHLMSVALADKCPDGCVMCVVDARSAKCIQPTVPIAGLDVLIKGEAAYWMTVWPSV